MGLQIWLGSSPKMQSRALLPQRDGSWLTHKWALNGFAILHELGAPNNHQEKEDHTWKHRASAWHALFCCNVCSSRKKVFHFSVSLSGAKLEIVRRFSKTAGAARSRKMVVNGEGSCSARSFSILSLAWQMIGADKQHPQSWIFEPYSMHPYYMQLSTAGEKEGKHGAESAPQINKFH